MNMDKENLIGLARLSGVNEYYFNSGRKNLIREIQQNQGHSPCFLTDARYRCNDTCEWEEDCKKLTAEWLR